MPKGKTKEKIENVDPVSAIADKHEQEKMISIPEDKLKKLVERMERLEYAASKSHLSVYDEKNKPEIGTKAHLNTYEGKIIVAWELIENLVERNPVSGVWTEKQTIRLYFHGGTTEEIPYVQFVRRLQRKEVMRKSKTVLDSGKEIWKVETITEGLEEPIELDIDVRFLN